MQFSTDQNRIEINTPTRDALVNAVRAHLRARSGFALATLNLDHLVKLRHDAAFAAAYAAQDIVVADGRPVVWLSRLARQPVDLLPGSDLVLPLCAVAASEGRAIAMIGSTEAALGDAADHLTRAVPGLKVAYTNAPAMGFDPDGPAAAEILRALEASGAGLCFLALGAPKQERLAARGRDLAPSVGFASIGAGLDFLGGHQRRAPTVVRRLALEWLWRALSSPRRMVPRYARCFAILPALTVQALRQRRRG
ncbi:WecB/TagA/CpsF family glycosyltransferase [Roseovarius sp. ZX-A-9]|uniref:WecB/TagA/CpsF family glycosyltransferase n=1 Tax=Roseovarius sp. ZX-A-9 TaxID=3014783 RepID=UPI00232C8F6B|nr:WecB/TagA/CpsF family glycosyltransferase [Roseovarius sp. ZX-A-9]